MRAEDLLEALRKKPFVPFCIHLLETVVYEIHHPDQVLVDRSKAVILVPDQAGQLAASDRLETVALLHITRLTPLVTPGSNEN